MASGSRFERPTPLTLTYTPEDGLGAGWIVGFTLVSSTSGKDSTVRMWARSPTGRVVRGPIQVSRICPVDDWPEFAQKAYDQSVVSENNERLF